MSDKTFYVTTPIYYWNWVPHIGHTYSSIIANVIYKYNKISGKKSRFTTWIDENSQKAVLKAQEAWMEIMDYLDDMAKKHKAVWDFFNIDYTDFIRTTEKRHHTLVREVLQKCFDRWDIYDGIYEWMYCIWCESFKKEEDLVYLNKETKATFPISDKVKVSDNIIKVCPDHLTEPQHSKEKNYFFRLKKYQTWIEGFYEANPDFVKPDFRYNEVKAFVKRWLEDFSISRETNTFWIPLPFDDKQVTYVWFDALFNYYTSCKYSRWWDKTNEEFSDESKEFWLENLNKVHIVWKDIIRFHAIFWPCMLASYFWLWEEKDWVIHYKESDRKCLPTTILTWWYFTVDGQKMSKSLWNVIEPVEYATKYWKELLTLYMLSAFPIWLDGDYDRNQAILTYNAKLANNLWNLVNRVVVLSLKLEKFNWILELKYPEYQLWIDSIKMTDLNFIDWLRIQTWFREFLWEEYEKFILDYNLKWCLDISFLILDKINKFVDINEPWKTIKEDEIQTKEVLYTIAEWLRQVWLALYPFFPEKMSEMFKKLWLENYTERLEAGELEKLISETPTFEIKEKWENLFNRFEI